MAAVAASALAPLGAAADGRGRHGVAQLRPTRCRFGLSSSVTSLIPTNAWRIATAHYYEACLHLERGLRIREVKEFIDSDLELVALHENALGLYEKQKAVTRRIRNEAAFHYAYKSGLATVAQALRGLSGERGTMAARPSAASRSLHVQRTMSAPAAARA